MTATVRITGDGASVDGRLVDVPAALDPVRYCLERVCRDDGPVPTLIVDERDGWEYRVLVHPDGHVEEDPDPPPTVQVTARRSRVGPAAAVVVVLAVAGWLAVDAMRRATEPPSASPGSTVLQGAAPLTVPLTGTTTPALTMPAATMTSSPALAPAAATTTRAAPTTTSAPHRTTRTRLRATTRRPPATTTTGPPATTTAPAPTPSVDGAAVARTVVDQLRADGAQVNRATCPALPAQLGATRRCTLVSDFGVFGVTVSVSRVRGSDVDFDITVDQRPR